MVSSIADECDILITSFESKRICTEVQQATRIDASNFLKWVKRQVQGERRLATHVIRQRIFIQRQRLTRTERGWQQCPEQNDWFIKAVFGKTLHKMKVPLYIPGQSLIGPCVLLGKCINSYDNLLVK